MARKIRFGGVRTRRFGAAIRRRALTVADDLYLCLSSLTSVPAIVLILLSLILAITHVPDTAVGAIHEWHKTYPNNVLFAFASKYLSKAVGLIAFSGPLVVAPRRSVPVALWLAVFSVVTMLPSYNYYQYMAGAAFTHVIAQSRHTSLRMLACVGLVLYVLFGHEALGELTHISKVFETMAKTKSRLPEVQLPSGTNRDISDRNGK